MQPVAALAPAASPAATGLSPKDCVKAPPRQHSFDVSRTLYFSVEFLNIHSSLSRYGPDLPPPFMFLTKCPIPQLLPQGFYRFGADIILNNFASQIQIPGKPHAVVLSFSLLRYWLFC